MNTKDKVAVCSRSFSRDVELREILLSKYKHVTFNDQGLSLEGDSLVSFLSGHDKTIIGLESITESILSSLPQLSVISKYGVGLDKVDMPALAKHNVRLGWTGGVNRRSVSELVIAFAISLLRHVPVAHREILTGTWRQHIGSQLTGKTVGIIGCGYVGKDLVKMLQPFECPILVNDILEYADFYKEYSVTPVSLDILLKESDVITLHTPLDETTDNLLSKQKLSLIRPSAILINAARGGLVDEDTLKLCLQKNLIAAAAFDVFSIEPPQDRSLLELNNFLVTPHIGGSAKEAVFAMGQAAIDGLDHNQLIDSHLYK